MNKRVAITECVTTTVLAVPTRSENEVSRQLKRVPKPRTRRSVPPTERATKRVMKPVGAQCALCQLSAGDYDQGVTQVTIMYGGRTYGDEGNELVALWKNLYLCDPCVKAIQGPEDGGRRVSSSATCDRSWEC